jgi:hypothetical protein
MALEPIDISGGLYESLDSEELPDPKFATVLKNLFVNDAGSNTDAPGLSQFAALPSIIVDGLAYFNSHVVVVTRNRRIYSIASDATVTDITGANVLGGTSRPTFADDGTYLAIAGGGPPQRWSGTGVCELMPGSPPDTAFITYLDGYWLLQMTASQEMRWAGPTAADRETWDANNFFQAEGAPDNLAAQHVLFRELWLVGEKSVETFQNVGDSTTPFQRSFFFDKGICAPYTILQEDNTLWWLDSDRKFVRIEGRTPVVKSGPIDKTIQRMTTVSDAWASSVHIDDKYFIILGFPTEQRTFVYDVKLDRWHERKGYRDGIEIYSPIHCHVFASGWNKHLVGGVFDGKVYELSFNYKSDGGDVMRRMRESGWIDWGTGKGKRSRYYLLHLKRGLGTPGATEPVCEIQVNDDGNGWTNPMQVGLGFPGDPKGPVRVDDLAGIYTKRKIRITMTDAVEFQLSKLEEEVEVLKS